MPPRAAPARGSRGGARGGRGAGPRGGDSGSFAFGLPSAGSHITTVGVKRPNFGTGGRELPIYANSFVTTIPEGVIHHYDGKLEIMVKFCALIFFFCSRFVYPGYMNLSESLICFLVITPAEKQLPIRLNMDIIEQLQLFTAPEIFTPRVVYDGRRNIFAVRQLPFGPSDSQVVSRTT